MSQQDNETKGSFKAGALTTCALQVAHIVINRKWGQWPHEWSELTWRKEGQATIYEYVFKMGLTGPITMKIIFPGSKWWRGTVELEGHVPARFKEKLGFELDEGVGRLVRK